MSSPYDAERCLDCGRELYWDALSGKHCDFRFHPGLCFDCQSGPVQFKSGHRAVPPAEAAAGVVANYAPRAGDEAGGGWRLKKGASGEEARLFAAWKRIIGRADGDRSSMAERAAVARVVPVQPRADAPG